MRSALLLIVGLLATVPGRSHAAERHDQAQMKAFLEKTGLLIEVVRQRGNRVLSARFVHPGGVHWRSRPVGDLYAPRVGGGTTLVSTINSLFWVNAGETLAIGSSRGTEYHQVPAIRDLRGLGAVMEHVTMRVKPRPPTLAVFAKENGFEVAVRRLAGGRFEATLRPFGKTGSIWAPGPGYLWGGAFAYPEALAGTGQSAAEARDALYLRFRGLRLIVNRDQPNHFEVTIPGDLTLSHRGR